MNIAIIKIGIFIVILSIIIYVVKNFNEVIEKLQKIKLKKYLKILFVIILIIFMFIFIKKLNSIKININWYSNSKTNDEINLKYDNMIIKENNFYNQLISKEYESQNPNNPYIPQNFKYVEGEWNNGFVIEDENKNQYVWVPCTNKDNSEIPKLQRTNYSENAFISKDICANLNYEKFIESALENGGFYISRFEIGKENNLPVSKPNVEIYSKLNQQQAMEVVANMYNNLNCELINGYAYDTTLNWIISKNDIEIDIVDVKNGEKPYSGRKKYNNIYDFFDNTMEITQENSYDTVIIRGFPFKENSEIENIANDKGYILIEQNGRFSILKDRNYYSVESTTLGFRAVLYK